VQTRLEEIEFKEYLPSKVYEKNAYCLSDRVIVVCYNARAGMA
jgi:hypothetical protein